MRTSPPSLRNAASRRVLRTHLFSLLVVGLLCGLFAGPADAQESIDNLSASEKSKFQQLLGRCIEAYNAGRHERALDYCAQAREQSPHPATSYVAARIDDLEGRCVAARDRYVQVRDGQVAADSSEYHWLAEYAEEVDGHVQRLGDCSPRVVATCDADSDTLAVINASVAARCGEVVPVEPGAVSVALTAPGQGVIEQQVDVPAETAPVEVNPGSVPPADPVSSGGDVACVDFPGGAALVSQGEVVGGCPRSVEAQALGAPLVALGPGGVNGMVHLPEDEAVAGAQVRITPDRVHGLSCAEPQTIVRVEVPTQRRVVEATCMELSASGGLALPDGVYELSFSLEYHDTHTEPLEVSGEPDAPLLVDALPRSEVAFTLSCPADEGLAGAQTHARVGDLSGPCPLTGKLPEGTYDVEVRREGHEAATFPLTLSHPSQGETELPAPEPRGFFTPGVIVAIAGGAVLTGAVIHDVASLSTLQDYQDAAQGNDRAEYDRLKTEVGDNILYSKIFYGVGVGVTLAGAGLIVYELLTQSPGDFESDTSAMDDDGDVLVMPTLVPTPDGGASGGVLMQWRF